MEKQLKSSDHNTSLDKSLSRIKSLNKKPALFKENESMQEYFTQPHKQQTNHQLSQMSQQTSQKMNEEKDGNF